MIMLACDVIDEGRVSGEATRGKRRTHLLSDLMKGKYVTIRRRAEDRKERLETVERLCKSSQRPLLE